MFDVVAQYYKALSEPTRLRILQYLLDDASCRCICDLQEHIDKDQSVLSRHIKVLEGAGLIKSSKNGKYLMLCVSDPDTLKKLFSLPLR
jgi:ArsR family transcriptional regulator